MKLVQWMEDKERKQAKRRTASSNPPGSKETSAKDKDTAKSFEGSLPRQTRAASVITDVSGPRVPQSCPDTPTVVELSAAPSAHHPNQLPSVSEPTLHPVSPAVSTASTAAGSGEHVHASVTLHGDTHRPSGSSEVIDPGPSVSARETVLPSAASEFIDLTSVAGTSGLSAMQVLTRTDQGGAFRAFLLPSEGNRENFQPAQSALTQQTSRRSRSRSRKSHKSRHRRRYSSSDSLSGSSSSPRRRKRSKRSSPEALSKILNLLTALSQKSSPSGEAAAASQPAPSVSGAGPSQVSHPLREDSRPPREDSVSEVEEADNVDNVSVQDDLQNINVQDRSDLFSLADRRSPDKRRDDSSSEDEPLYGTDIPEDVFNRAVSILRNHLGFESADPGLPPSKSKLSLNKPTRSARVSLPVDAECEDRYKAVAASKKWSAFSKSQLSSFRVDEKERKDLFKTPSVPQVSEDYLRSVGAIDSSGKWKCPADKRYLKSFQQIDTASRAGLKYSSALLLIAEVLTKSFHTSDISRKDTATLVSLVGPIARRVYDQFVRASVKSVLVQRDIVLEAMRLPQMDIKRRFRELPFSGEDIFGGQFDSQLQTEAKRRKDLLKASLSSPRLQSGLGRGSKSKRFQSRSSRRNQPSSLASGSSRRPSSFFSQQKRTQRASDRSSRGSSRGSSSSRGRGFSRP